MFDEEIERIMKDLELQKLGGYDIFDFTNSLNFMFAFMKLMSNSTDLPVAQIQSLFFKSVGYNLITTNQEPLVKESIDLMHHWSKMARFEPSKHLN